MAWRGVRHFYRGELVEWLSESDATQQQLPGEKRGENEVTSAERTKNRRITESNVVVTLPFTNITRLVLVHGTSSAATDAVHILVTFRGVLSKVDT